MVSNYLNYISFLNDAPLCPILLSGCCYGITLGGMALGGMALGGMGLGGMGPGLTLLG